MRPVSSRVALWMSVLSILVALFAFESLTFAQTNSPSKRDLVLPGNQLVYGQMFGSRLASARLGQGNGPQTGTDTWTGGGGSNTDWSDTSNWNNGSPSGQNVAITASSAATTVDQSFSIGTLTLGSGDSVTASSGQALTVGGNIVNNGTITLNSTYYGTYLDIGASLTLSGSGVVVMGGTGPNYIGGATGATLTNTSTIEGGGGDNVGNGQIAFNNSTGGVINANTSGTTLYLDPGAASTNTGTLEATNGGTLQLEGSSWTNTGGLITAAAASTVYLDGVGVTGGTLTAVGTGVIEGLNNSLTNVTINGTYDVVNNGSTSISGTITNNGTINLDSTYYNTALYLATNSTLTGSGSVILGGSNADYITGAAGTILTNDQLIQGGGGGNVGDGVLTLVNNGTINANVSGTNLVVQPLSTSTNTNAGTLEATNGGTLILDGGSWTNTGALITAAAGSTVELNGSSVTGGTLTAVGTGVIIGENNSLTGLTINGTYDVAADTTTNISGTITNNGTINLASTYYDTYLTVPTNTSTTLTGTGSVILGGNANYINGGTNSSLTIDENITGAGYIGNGTITTIVNNSTINANLSPTVNNNPLTITPGTGGLTNGTNGILEATNGGTLILYGGTVTNNGTIEALGADSSNNASVVKLQNGVSITGGTLNTSGTGVVEGDGTVYLTNITNKGTYDVVAGTTTEISGTITNTGTINLASTYYNTELYLAANSTLTGAGSVVLGGGPNIITGASGTTLTIEQTIEGAGYVGYGVIGLVNKSTLDANVSGGTLYLDPGAASTNSGTMEATNGGTLVLYGSSWTNSGTISAATGSTVSLQDGVSVTGGTLTTAGTGVIQGDGTVSLTSITNKGTYDVVAGTTTEISGTITNTGTINLASTYYTTDLYLAASSTLTGKNGAVILGGNPNEITGASGATLTNKETIEGAGYIGNGTLKIANSSIIDANVSGGTLHLYPAVASTNTATLEATNGGTLEFDGGKWTQTGKGTITAATGSTVDITNSTSITGGVLTTSGTGVIVGGGTVLLSNLTNNGTYIVGNSEVTEISGTITNNGTINLQSTYYSTYLDLNGNTTLNGTGAVILAGGDNYIGGTGSYTLTNDSTIEGAGSLGNSQITITNNGTFDANVSGQNLNILPGSGGFTNYNASTNTLTGGTYIANAGNLTFAGSSTGITTLSATVVEENGGQFIDTNGNFNALKNLTSITSSGSLTTDVNFTDSGSFSNAGSLTILGSTTFDVGSLAQISGNTLNGGTYVLYSNLNLTGAAQNITTIASGASLTLADGTIENTSNSTSALTNLATNNGTFGLANNASFTTAGNFNNTGTLAIAKGSTFTVTGTLAQISGSTLASGGYVLGGTLEVGNGISITTNAANLTLEGGTIESGSSNALANLATNTGTLAVANSSSFTTAGSFANSGTLNVNSGSTFKIGGSSTAYNQSAGTTNVDGTLTGTINVTGGAIQGTGSLNGNVSVGPGIISAGDAGQAGLLKITGSYTQLSSGTMNANIGGTTLGTQYSQLKVTGAASLSGSLTVSLINGYTPKVNAKFTILTAKSFTGSFSTQYIVINGSEYFAVSYTSKGVVLTVDSGVPPVGSDSGNTDNVIRVARHEKHNKKGDAEHNERQVASHAQVAKASHSAAYAPGGSYRLGGNGTLERPYRLPNVPTWTASARPVELPTSPAFRLNGTLIHPVNNWSTASPDHGLSQRVPMMNNGWQKNEARGTAMKRLLPSLR